MKGLVAYQGAPGAFGEEACIRFLPLWSPVAYSSFPAVVAAVLARKAERGTLPLHNSTAGAVPGVDDLIHSSGVVLLSRHRLPVRLHLLAVPGARHEAITSVASHPMALAQARKWLAERRLSQEAAANTAMAALALSKTGDKTRAVIASEAAARAYGLSIIARDIHDNANNATIFGVVARQDRSDR